MPTRMASLSISTCSRKPNVSWPAPTSQCWTTNCLPSRRLQSLPRNTFHDPLTNWKPLHARAKHGRHGKHISVQPTLHANSKCTIKDNVGHTLLLDIRKASGALLWRVNITPQPTTTLATTSTLTAHLATQQYPPKLTTRAYNLPSMPALIAYLHATVGFPVKQTWLEAIKREAYAMRPGLSYSLVARHCPTADEMYKGHMGNHTSTFGPRTSHHQEHPALQCHRPQQTIAPSSASSQSTRYSPMTLGASHHRHKVATNTSWLPFTV